MVFTTILEALQASRIDVDREALLAVANRLRLVVWTTDWLGTLRPPGPTTKKEQQHD